MNICTVENLSKHYPKFSVQNISFSLAQRQNYGIDWKKNGAGKSTVIKVY